MFLLNKLYYNLLCVYFQDKNTYGGSFLYHLGDSENPLVTAGFVVNTFMSNYF